MVAVETETSVTLLQGSAADVVVAFGEAHPHKKRITVGKIVVDANRIHIDISLGARVSSEIICKSELSISRSIRRGVDEALEGFRDGADPGVPNDVPGKNLACRRVY